MIRLSFAVAFGATLAGCAIYPSPSSQNLYLTGGSSGAGSTGGGTNGAASTGASSGAWSSSGGASRSTTGGSSGASTASGSASSGGTAGSSGTAGSASAGGTTSGTGASTSGGGSSGASGPRVLATGVTLSTNAPTVWDITNPAAVTPIISNALIQGTSDDYPAAVAIGSDGEIFVQMAFNGLFVFDASASFLGNIVVPWPSNYSFPEPALDGTGIAYVPQAAGPAVLVDCGFNTGLSAFAYDGPADFDGGTTDSPAALWMDLNPNYFGEQCLAGPSNTVLAATISSLNLVEIADGGWRTYEQPTGTVYGGAVDSTSGDIFVVGTDEENAGGFAELYTQGGACSIITAGACANTDCAGSTCAVDAALPNLNQATALGSSLFLATAGSQDSPASTILGLNMTTLTVSTYYSDTGAGFYGLATAP